MHTGLRVQLSVMMFFQFFLWGSWYVTMGTYLLAIGFDAVSVGAAYSTTTLGAIFAPVVAGMLADRFFEGQKVMGTLHVLGAGLLWFVSGISEPGPFFWILLAYSIIYMPTLGLANAISFHQMSEPGKQFPGIRVMGTVGWIVAGVLIGAVIPGITGASVEPTNVPLQIGAVTSLVLGLYCFLLPATPPGAAGTKPSLSQMLGLETIALMKDRSFAIFIIGSILICIPLTFYYNFANAFLNESGMQNAAFKMTFGQVSEAAFLLLIPAFFVRLGVKKMLLIGMGAWVLRYVLFAFGDNDSLVFMLYGGIILHGVCFDFFFVTGQLYTDRAAPKALRASAQGFIHVATYGVGMLIGSWVSGYVVDAYTSLDAAGVQVHDWTSIWIVPAVMAAVVMGLFIVAFKEPPKA